MNPLKEKNPKTRCKKMASYPAEKRIFGRSSFFFPRKTEVNVFRKSKITLKIFAVEFAFKGEPP